MRSTPLHASEELILPNASPLNVVISDSLPINTPCPSPWSTPADIGVPTNVTVSLTFVPLTLPVDDRVVSILGSFGIQDSLTHYFSL